MQQNADDHVRGRCLNAFKSQKALHYLHINGIMVMLLVYGRIGLLSIIIPMNSANVNSPLVSIPTPTNASLRVLVARTDRH